LVTLPVEAYGQLCVEIESATTADAREDFDGCVYWVDAEAVEGILDTAPPSFELGPPVADAPAEDAQGGRILSEDGRSENHGFGVLFGCFHEAWDVSHVVLAVRVNDSNVRPSEGLREVKADENGGTFSSIFRRCEDVQIWFVWVRVSECVLASVGTTVEHHDDGLPNLEGAFHGFQQEATGVIAWNQHAVCLIVLRDHGRHLPTSSRLRNQVLRPEGNDMEGRKQAAREISRAFPVSRWTKGYIKSKLLTDPVFEAALEKLRDRSGTVVDLGCGLGLLAFWLRRHGNDQRVVGYEQSDWKVAAGMEAARRLEYLGIDLRRGNMLDADLSGADVVCAFDVLHYLEHAQQREFLKKLAGAARSGSLVVVRTGVRGSGWRSWLTVLEEVGTRVVGWIRGGAVNFPTIEQLETSFLEEGCSMQSRPLWGRTPFSSHWLVIERID